MQPPIEPEGETLGKPANGSDRPTSSAGDRRHAERAVRIRIRRAGRFESWKWPRSGSHLPPLSPPSHRRSSRKPKTVRP